MSVEPSPPQTYDDAMRAADQALDDGLAVLRRRQDAGEITTAQAATERVTLLEHHLDQARQARRQFLRES
jgi:hypothetical protein